MRKRLSPSCPACGEQAVRRKTYCEKRCTAHPLAATGFTYPGKPAETPAPFPHLHVECHECGYTVLTPPHDPEATAEGRYGPDVHSPGRT